MPTTAMILLYDSEGDSLKPKGLSPIEWEKFKQLFSDGEVVQISLRQTQSDEEPPLRLSSLSNPDKKVALFGRQVRALRDAGIVIITQNTDLNLDAFK